MTLARMAERDFTPEPLDYSRPDIRGRLRPPMRQPDRAIDWRHDDTATVLRKIRAADGSPGVRDEIAGLPCYLYDAHREGRLRGAAGAIVAQRDGAICRATRRRRDMDHASEARRRPQRVQAARRDGSRRRDRSGSRGAAARRRNRRLSDVAPDSIRGGRAGRVPALSVLQRRDGHGAVRSAAPRPMRMRARGPRA